jgi:hypothetical protein
MSFGKDKASRGDESSGRRPPKYAHTFIPLKADNGQGVAHLPRIVSPV